MDYYQTEVFLPVEQEWKSVSLIQPKGDLLEIFESKKLRSEDVDAELERLRRIYNSFDFRVMPWSND